VRTLTRLGTQAEPAAGAARRSFTRACTVGAALATAVFTWMVSIGQLDFFQSHVLDNIYDAQAHSLLAGHWDIPRDKLGFEAFVIGDKTYTYLGIWPTILRLPVAALTHSFDGRLTQCSLLAAFVVLIVATGRLLWRVRSLVRADVAVTRAERWAVATFMLVVGAGSVVLFLASRPVVYHEAELWGAAWSIAAFASILEFLVQPGRRALAWSGVCTALALLSRGSVALGPVVALAIIFGGRLLAELSSRLRRVRLSTRTLAMLGLGEDAANRGYLIGLLTALVLPLAAYAYVNDARFGELFGLPISKQIATTIDPIRPKIFAGTHGSLFALKFVPTDLVAMFRPDAISFDRVFPFVTFPARAHVVGHVTFAAIDPSTSAPASMPFLFVLALVGVFAVFLARRTRGRNSGDSSPNPFAPLRVLVAGGVVGALGVVTIPFISQRYFSDLLPLLALLASAGLYLTLSRFEARSDTKPRRLGARSAITIGLAALAVLSLWVNFALALVYQREYSPFTAASERAAFVRFQHAAPGGSNMPVQGGPSLPAPLAAGTLFVVGDCAGVYWSDGHAWYSIERTSATGRFPLHLTFPKRPPGTSETVLAAGPDRVRVEYIDAGDIRFELTSPNLTAPAVGDPVAIIPGRPTPVEIVFDPLVGTFDVTVHKKTVLAVAYVLARNPVRVAGRDRDASVDFSGLAELDPTPPSFCSDLTVR
jgi:hypothetical protein